MFTRHKKTVITLVLLSAVVFRAYQVLHYQEKYSPLQMLYSAENEAQRLLKFLTSYHYHCNNTLNNSRAFTWSICVDQDVGISQDPSVPKIAYSIGPLPDYSFETVLSQNLSVQQLVFLPKSGAATPRTLLQLNATVFRTTVVPNDPADFSRNSYDMNTINSIMSILRHHRVDVLKLEHVLDVTHSYEILYYLVKDGILTRFHQLHIVIEIDKVDESYLYNWYKTLYSLFHSAGFRLYHTFASNPLCVQVTMMESCRYFLSWVQAPGPQTAVLYPPALDGSEENEVQRLEDFLGIPEQSDEDIVPVVLSRSTVLRLSRRTVMSGTDSCHILVFQFEKDSAVKEKVSALHVKCAVTVLTPHSRNHEIHSLSSFTVRSPQVDREMMTMSRGISRFLSANIQTNIVYINLGSSSWSVLSCLLDSGAVQNVMQLVMVAPVYQISGQRSAQVLRQHYSELKRVTAFHLTLSEVMTPAQSSFMLMSFVKS